MKIANTQRAITPKVGKPELPFIRSVCCLMVFKAGLPYLLHSFRKKCFNKISLGNMLYFQNKL